MSVTDKQIKEFENEAKKAVYGSINNLSSQQASLILSIQRLGKHTNQITNIPNIGITLNNKLVDLSHQFEDAGISIFSQVYGDSINSSVVGQAVIMDLVSYVGRGTQTLADYRKALTDITTPKVNEIQSLEKAGPIKKFFYRIRNLFVSSAPAGITYTDEDTKQLNSHLQDFKAIDDELWEYNLKSNLVPSLAKYIHNQYKDFSRVPGILSEFVLPDMEKLGLSEEMSELAQSLAELYMPKDFKETIKVNHITLNQPSESTTEPRVRESVASKEK